MSNQEIAEIKPFLVGFIIFITYLVFMLYQYKEVCKSIAITFKSTIVAFLIIIGVIDNSEK
jgi:hypothetical protein